MHKEVRDHIKAVRRKYPTRFFFSRVLEAGSLYVNGTVRDYFYFSTEYLGLDIGQGKCVDMVCPIERFSAPIKYDVVISCEMLEHSHRWEDALRSMYNNLKPNGLLIMTCAAPHRLPHGVTNSKDPESSPFTNDYYRNISMEDFEWVLPPNLFSEYNLQYIRGKQDLMFYGIKIDNPASFGTSYTQ